MNSALFTPSLKNKKSPPGENFLYFRKTETPIKFPVFSKKKRELRKSYLYFRKRKFLVNY